MRAPRTAARAGSKAHARTCARARQTLDLRKDEDLLRTFKGVSKHFKEVFKELVPGGSAAVVMCAPRRCWWWW